MSKNNSELIDFPGLLRAYAAKWYWFLTSVIICCTAGFIYSRTVKPEYEVRANIILADENGASHLMAGGLSGMSDLLGTNANATDEVAILMSHSVLRNVTRQLGLNRDHIVRKFPLISRFAYDDFPVDVVPDPEINIDTLRTALYFDIHLHKNGRADISLEAKRKTVANEKSVPLPHTLQTPWGKFTVTTTPHWKKGSDIKTSISIVNFDIAAENLRRSIGAGLASKHSRIISLQIITDNVDYASDVLNTLIAQYNARSTDEQQQQTSATADFINDRVTMLRGELNRTESLIADYKQNEKIADIQSNGSVIFERMKETEKSLQESEINLRITRFVLQSIRESAKDNSPVPVQGSDAVAAQIREYNRMLLRRQRMAESARPDNPALIRLDDEIETYRNTLLATISSNVERLEILAREFRDVYNTTLSQVADIPAQEKTFHAIERERAIQEQIYLFLLQKQEETAILLSNISPKGVIIDQAYSLNENKAVTTTVIMLMAFVLGLAIPPVIMLARKLFRRKFDTLEEVENRTDIPVLGEICEDKSGRSLVVRPGEVTPSAELFRLIRTNLQFILRGADNKVVLVTSTTSGEGKSFISVNLAASMAIMRKRTLLIGMDIRRPRLASYLDINPSRGLTQYLADPSIGIDSIITPNAVMTDFDLIVAGPTPPNPAEMLASDTVDNLFAQLRRRYDYIIIDAAPVGMVSDTFLLNRIADATLYITRAAHTNLSDIDFASRIADDKRLPHMAIVVNGTKSRKGYGYGYGEKNRK